MKNIKISDLKLRTTEGVFWNFLEMTGRHGIGILVTLFLARFLAPCDFGLVAMLSVFFAIANALMDVGFRQALIRKKDVSPVDYSTMFFTNLGLGLLAYCFLFISAPFIAAFYLEPRLIVLARAVGVAVIINSFQFVQVVDLTRRMDFKTQFKVTVPAGFISGIVAITMAYYGFGVWSLATQMILSPLLITVSLWLVNSLRPTMEFSTESFRDLFAFGSKLFLSGLLDIVFRNIYLVVIAKLFTASITGYYFFATKVREAILHQLSGSIQKVTYPALSSIQDDGARLKNGYRQVIQATTYIIFPAMIFLGVLARPLFEIFLHPKWFPGIPYLQILCIGGLLYPLHVVNLNMLQVKGRSDLFLYLEILKKILIVTVLVISIRFGIWGLLWGQVFASFVAYLPNSYFSSKLIGYGPFEQIKDVLPALLAAVIAGVGAHGLGLLLQRPEDNLFVLMAQGLAGMGIYFLVASMFKLQIQEVFFLLLKKHVTKRFRLD